MTQNCNYNLKFQFEFLSVSPIIIIIIRFETSKNTYEKNLTQY